MTNGEKFKTAKEREEAFKKFCNERNCGTCPLYEEEGCKFAWLDLEAPLTADEVADTLAKYSTWRQGSKEFSSPCTWEEVNTAIDRAVELLRNIKE